MALDTGPLLAALEPPAFRHEGIEYRGRHLSILEWQTKMERMAAFGDGTMDLAAQQAFYADLCNGWFPPPPRRWGIGPRVGRSVADIVLSLPPLVQDQVVASFIRSQQRANGLTVPAAGSITTAPTTT